MSIPTYLSVGGAALAIIAAAPYLLSDSKRVERTAKIEASPAEVYKLLASNEGFQVFNPYKDSDPNLKISLIGPESGLGSGFAFDGKDGKGTQTITHVSENEAVTMEIDLGAMGKPIQSFKLKPTDDGTEVVWDVEASFGMNPIGRVFGLFMERMQGPIIERGLDNLSRAFKQAA